MGDIVFYLRREQDERDLAAKARDPDIRAIHQTMADQYAQLAQQEADRRPNRPPDRL